MAENKDRTPHLFANDWYEDITDQFTKDVSKLSNGEMIENTNFRLSDTLAAFQIGTHKIDTGSPSEYKTLSEELLKAHSDYPINDDKRGKEFLNQLVGLEMAWHYGHSLLQTVISNLEVEELIRTLENLKKNNMDYLEAIRLYIKSLDLTDVESLAKIGTVALIKSISVSCNIAGKDGVGALFPEEDLHFDAYGVYLLDDYPLQEVVELVDQARKSASKCGFLEMSKHFEMYSLWLTVLKQKINKNTQNIVRLQKLVESTLSEEDEVENVKSYLSRGCQARFNNSSIRQPLVNFSVKDSKNHWIKILTAMVKFAPVYNIERSVDLTGFYLQFCSRQEPAIVRAMAKFLVSENNILSQPARTWCQHDIYEVTPLEITPNKTKAKKNKKTLESEFLSQAVLCYTDLLTVFCRNRTRFREGLATLVLSFDSLQVSAQKADTQLIVEEKEAQFTLAHWTYLRKLQTMIWVIFLAFESDCVSYSEMGYCFWYVHILCQQLLAHLGRMRSKFETAGKNARDQPGYGYLVSLELEMQMLAQLSSAEFMLFIALHKLKPPHQRKHSSDDAVFRLRFQMFDSVAIPEMPKLESYKELYEALDVTTALKGAASGALSVRNLLSQLGSLANDNEDIPKLKRSSIGLGIAVSTVIKLGEQPIEVELQHEGYHNYFPVPNITSKK